MPRIRFLNDMHTLIQAGEMHPGMQIADDRLGVYGTVEKAEHIDAAVVCDHGWSGPWNSRPCGCRPRVALTMLRGVMDWEIDEVDVTERLLVVCAPGATSPVSMSPAFNLEA